MYIAYTFTLLQFHTIPIYFNRNITIYIEVELESSVGKLLYSTVISIFKILFTDAISPFLLFFSSNKTIHCLSRAAFIYVCTNDWACLVYLRKANPRRKSLFIKKGLVCQVVGFVTVKTVENLYTGYMANIQSTSFGFILMPSAIISQIIRVTVGKTLFKGSS